MGAGSLPWTLAVALALAVALPARAQTASPLITAASSGFGTFIEGAAVDQTGTAYAVNFGADRATVGQFSSTGGSSSLFFSLANAGTSSFNGIRFADGGSTMYIADPVGRRVLAGNPRAMGSARTICQDQAMLVGVPNDLAITTSGRLLFLSGQVYGVTGTDRDGQIWVCDTVTGRAALLETMGRTNGIEISPDNTALYVSEAYNRDSAPVSNVIWRFALDAATGTITARTLFANFTTLDNSGNVDVDGMRVDTAGNLYVTRNGGGEVVRFSPAGVLLARIRVSMRNPTNLELGGDRGTTLFVVGRCGTSAYGDGVGCVDTAQVDTPGRAFSELRAAAGEW